MTIDWWTLGIQTVNVAILVWLLQRFFWRPVAGMIEQRRDATRRTMAEAAAAKARATAALAQIEQTRAGFAKERDAILAEARAAAEMARAAVLADAAKQAATLEATLRAAIERESQAVAGAWAERSAQLAVAIAGQLAARLDGALVHEAFLDWLVREIEALPDITRRATTDSDAALEVISATTLDPVRQGHVRERVGEALGGDLAIGFRTDPALIAGLELHGPHLLISNSWRADLARILADLTARTDTNDGPAPRHARRGAPMDALDEPHAG